MKDQILGYIEIVKGFVFVAVTFARWYVLLVLAWIAAGLACGCPKGSRVERALLGMSVSLALRTGLQRVVE